MNFEAKALIAVCTYKRPVMLKQCLTSLTKIDIPEEMLVSVLVVENGEKDSAESVINNVSKESPIQIHCCNEPRRGIAFARNKALSFAHDYTADILIFIDDDEWVEPDWLRNFSEYRKQLDDEAILFGKVLPDLPDNCPDYLTFFYHQKERTTGTLLETCGTNNVFIPMKIIRKLNLTFDETSPLSGGEDGRFFREATSQGAIIHTCSEAIVHETIPKSRVSLKWLSQRKFSTGAHKAHYKLKNKGRIVFFMTTFAKSFLYTIFSLLHIAVGLRHRSIKYWLKSCSTAGLAFASIGISHAEYRKTHGH